MERINQLIDVPSTDPDDARRRKVTNILVLFLLAVVILQLAVVLVLEIMGLPLPAPLSDPTFRRQGYINSIAVLTVCAIIYAINRYWSGAVAGSIFTLLMSGAMIMNTPDNPVVAKATFGLTISVALATLFVHSYAGFVMAGISTVVIAIIGVRAGTGLYLASAGNFFGVALFFWFAAHSLERALKDLRVLNVELDQRVQERTRDLAESLSKTEAILESTADGVIVFDKHGRATVANPAVANLLTHSAKEIVGHDFETLMNKNVRDEDRDTITHLLHGQKMEEPSIKIKWGSKTFSTSVAPVHLDSGEEIGTVAVFRDFTREAEIDRMKSTFVSIASHELRTPLNAIMGYAEMLREEIYGEMTDQQTDAVKRILANTNHMLNLANNLLDRAQIEAGTLELNVRSFSPTATIDEAIGAMDVLAHNRGLDLSGSITDDVPDEVIGDQQRVSQIVVNLIANALKFTREGQVNVRAYMHDDDHWAIAVSDTGIGIPEEVQQQIFEPFRRADESPTREYRGAGLGLSIVKQLAEMMGGTIELESEVGKGSAFTITLPLVPKEPDSDESGE